MNKITVFLLVSILSGGVLFLIFSESQSQPIPQEYNTTTGGIPVSYTTVTPQSYPATIKAFGSVTPLWQTTIRSQVDGTINTIHPKLQPGNRVHKEDVLLQIDPRPYRAALEEAKSRYAHARVAYLKEIREGDEARKNWKRSGLTGTPVSSLVFRMPQQDAALADMHSAKAAMIHAQKRLEETNITAPYDGVIISRAVNIKESLFTGDEVAVLFADERAEIPVKLDLLQWDRLPKTLETAKVTLKEPRLGHTWPATIKRRGQTFESQSGLRTLYLEIQSPLKQDPPLLPGMFVEAHIQGKHYPNLLRLPETALTKRGYIWRIDANHLLRSHSVDVLFYGEGVVYVKTPLLDTTLQVATQPNNSFVNAQRVLPIPSR